MTDSTAELEAAIGRVNIIWNDLHYVIFEIFWLLLRRDSVAATALFFSTQSDRAQRKMVASLAKARFGEGSNEANLIISTLELANKLAGRRNDVIHAMWDWAHPDGLSVIAESSKRLARKDWRRELENLHEEIAGAALKIADLLEALIPTVPEPLVPPEYSEQHERFVPLTDQQIANMATGNRLRNPKGKRSPS